MKLARIAVATGVSLMAFSALDLEADGASAREGASRLARLTGSPGAESSTASPAIGAVRPAGHQAAAAGMCGLYDDAGAFDADLGPFTRALNNFEDFELTNSPPGQMCPLEGPILDCDLHPGRAGFCAQPLVEAGDILPGLRIEDNLLRPPGALSVILWDFQAPASKYVIANYFGDWLNVSFPTSPAPVGCATLAPGPNLAGFRTNSDSITVNLASGARLTFPSAGTGFLGVCCDEEIVSIEVPEGVDDLRWGRSLPTPACLAGNVTRIVHRGLMASLSPASPALPTAAT